MSANQATFEQIFGFGRPDPFDKKETEAVVSRLRELAMAFKTADDAVMTPAREGKASDEEMDGLQEKRRRAYFDFLAAKVRAEEAGFIVPRFDDIHLELTGGARVSVH